MRTNTSVREDAIPSTLIDCPISPARHVERQRSTCAICALRATGSVDSQFPGNATSSGRRRPSFVGTFHRTFHSLAPTAVSSRYPGRTS
jgi:hypothetical protein